MTHKLHLILTTASVILMLVFGAFSYAMWNGIIVTPENQADFIQQIAALIKK